MADSSFLSIAFGGTRPLFIASGFAALAIVATAFAVPSANTMMAKLLSPSLENTDPTTTASVTQEGQESKSKSTKRYILRRSVLQKSPRSECRIYVTGKREGDC